MASREKNDDLCIGHRQLFTDYYIKDVIKKKRKSCDFRTRITNKLYRVPKN